MDARTLQALMREHLSIILASTEKPVAVERTTKVVGVKLTSACKDCSIRLSKSKITSARKHSKSWFIRSRRIRIKKRDLKQNRAFNPFSEQSKEMIYGMGNMEYFEICEITPKIQCHKCLTYWTKGIVYFTCGTCLRPSDKIRKRNSDRYDVLSIPNSVIKKGPRGTSREFREAKDLPCSPCLISKGTEKGIQIHSGWILE